MIPSSVIRHPSTSYRMPAEWEKHDATWLAWPHNKNDWPGKFEPIPWVYAEIIRWIAQHERVRLVVKDAKEKAKAQDILGRAEVNLRQVDFFIIPTDRIWLRDSGPIFVHSCPPLEGGRNFRKEIRGGYKKAIATPPDFSREKSALPQGEGEKVMVDWKFNAWAKYDNHKRDDKVPAAIEHYLRYPRVQPMHNGKRVVLEGGSIDVNGKGTLLTTEECLLSKIQCRNPGFTRGDYEAVFERYLGIQQVIWLGDGIKGDDTHGHVDDLARFVNADTVVTVVEKNKRDDNFKPLQDNLKRLRKARDQNGKPLNVVELPMPRPLIFEGTQLPASYANFLICNDLVIVPTFNDPSDRIALSILADCFPKREIVGIHSVDLVWGFGTLHCMSQQEPA